MDGTLKEENKKKREISIEHSSILSWKNIYENFIKNVVFLALTSHYKDFLMTRDFILFNFWSSFYISFYVLYISFGCD